MVDWAQFNVKNEGNESKAFEEMIYLLFCAKYDRKEGIFGHFGTFSLVVHRDIIKYSRTYSTTKYETWTF